jgi:pyridoxamine 5'-phosphate oxidase
MSHKLWHHGAQYAGETIDPANCPDDPLELFAAWFADAEAAAIPNVNAMTLATVGDGGRPAARIVLLKELDERGFVFFTSYESRKARELEASGRAALLFYWQPFDRQIRIEGTVERLEADRSDAYFATRPLGSRIAAIASPPSHPLASRAELEARVAEVTASLAGADPARPATWGGYRVVADAVEFWQGQPSRLHDRVLYDRAADGTWMKTRLAP